MRTESEPKFSKNGPWPPRGKIFCTFPNFDSDHIFQHAIQTFPNILTVLKSQFLVELFQMIFSTLNVRVRFLLVRVRQTLSQATKGKKYHAHRIRDCKKYDDQTVN